MQYSNVYDFANLYEAYLKARKQKRYRSEVLQFSYCLERELLILQKELKEKTYATGEYRPFTIYEPKKRKVVALPFRDRVVQHALNNIIEPVFDRRMIADSFACRAGKGTHAAAKRVSYFMGKPSNAYYLKLDVKSFFASVDKNILKRVIRNTIEDKDILRLIDVILDSSPVPGLPIGNLTSQLFANVYLHELDHHCKNNLGVSYYARYMDDVLILSHSKSYLQAVLANIREFISERLALELNSKTRIGKCKDGVEFVGFRIWRNLRLIKKQSLARMKKKVRAWKSGKIQDEKFMASLGSWMGHAVGTSSYRGVMRVVLDSMREMSARSVRSTKDGR
jgi:retron-type reverse transcriptase